MLEANPGAMVQRARVQVREAFHRARHDGTQEKPEKSGRGFARLSRGDAAAKVAGGLAGLGLLSQLFGGAAEEREHPSVPAERLTDGYIDRLAASIDRRLHEGDTFTEALGGALRDRAPILLRPEAPARSSVGAWAAGLGLAAVSAALLFTAARRLRGHGRGEGVEQDARRTSGQTDEEARSSASEGPAAGEHYRPVHGTGGAEMPGAG